LPLFRYKGYRADGSEVSGTLEADGPKSAALSVRALGIYPKEVSVIEPKGKRLFKVRASSVLPHITRQLATLLSSGVPLSEALRTLKDESRGQTQEVLSDIRERLMSGESLPRALGAHPEIFPDFYISLVAAGIESGALERVLERLSDFLEEEASIRAKVRTSLIYPIFMVCVSFVVLAFLFVFVIPKIVRIFENAKTTLPLSTKILIALSNFFVHYWWGAALLLFVLAFTQKGLIKRYRANIDRLKLKIPVIESLYLARFARTLGFLLEGGVPMLKALELSAKASGNIVIRESLLDATKRVAEGAKLSHSLAAMPPVLLELISTGERTGKLPELLSKAADAYEEDFTRKTERALSLLEPSMVVLMGLVIGFIVLSVLLPLFQLNQLIK